MSVFGLDFIGNLINYMNPEKKKTGVTVRVHENNPLANLSKQAYNSNYDQVNQDIAKFGYEVDRDLSNPNATVYKHKKTGEAVIGYRGTDPSNNDDIEADKHIAMGSRKHQRFDDAVNLADRVSRKYKKVRVTGHSLGGTQALHVNRERGLDANAYNPGSGLFGGFDADNYKNKNAKIVKNPYDKISQNARGITSKEVTSGGYVNLNNLLNPLKFLEYHKIF